MAFGDPFDFSNSDVPAQGGGISPDFWKNLLLFGGNLAASANARDGRGFLTYGNGFAGPFGAAIGQTAQSNMEMAKNRAANNLANTRAYGESIDNYGKVLGLPAMQARARMQQQYYSDPAGFMRQMGFTPQDVPGALGPQSQAEPQQDGGTPFAANNPLNMRFAGQEGAFNTKGFAAFPTPEAGQAATDRQFGLYADRGVKTLRSLISTWAPPSENNTDAYIGTVSAATGIKPDDEIDLRHPGTAAAIQQAMARVEGNRNGRVQVASAGNVATDAAPQGAPAPQQVAQAAPVQLAPQQSQGPSLAAQYLSTAQRYEQQANAAQQMKDLGIPVPVDPAALRQAAQQHRAKALELQSAGPIAGAQEAGKLPYVGPAERAKAANSNVDLRPGGMVRTFDPVTHQEVWVKNPAVEDTQDVSGATIPMHVSPALPGSPPGTAGTAEPILGPDGKPIVKKLPPNVQLGRNKAYEDFAGKDTDSYIAAQNTHAWLEQMDHAAADLNSSGGFLNTGPTSPARLKFASTVNDILRTAGLPNAFDPAKIASWEEFKKATTTAGFELSSHYEGHARQAAQTIVNATSAVPAPENSPVGGLLVSSGIREAAQSAIDLHQYKQTVADKNGDLVKGETEFYKQNPAQMYARRAISRMTPYEVSDDKQLNRYLPGTFLKYKGQVVQVPNRDGAPPIPEYLVGAQPFNVPH